MTAGGENPGMRAAAVSHDNALSQRRGGFWPTPEQELLLRAALLDGGEARQAWQAWHSLADFEALDPGSFRLLPLLYRNLLNLGIDAPLLPRIKGVYRHFWYRNQVLFHHMAKMLASFQQAGIRTLLLKGAPYSLLYYRDPPTRPMGDFDLLIHPDDLGKSLEILQSGKWQPIYFDSFAALTPGYLSYATSHGFRDPDGREFDLHWHLSPYCAAPDCDHGFWARSQPLVFGGVPARTLAAGDHLLHVCVHGAAWDEIPPIRWVADALLILRTAKQEIDWSSLIAEAQRHQVILPLRETFAYLHREFQAPIPQEVLTALQQTATTAGERREFAARTRPLRQRGPLLELWLLRRHYLRWRQREQSQPQLVGFLRTMQYTAKRTDLRQLPCYAFKRGMERLGMVRPSPAERP